MGYWQNGIEIDKNGMLPNGNAGLIRVKTKRTIFLTKKTSGNHVMERNFSTKNLQDVAQFLKR